MTNDPNFDAEAARQARLAAALRQNLLKRKARDRASELPPETLAETLPETPA